MMLVMTMVVVTVVCVPLDPLHLRARCNQVPVQGNFLKFLSPRCSHVMSSTARANPFNQPTNTFYPVATTAAHDNLLGN